MNLPSEFEFRLTLPRAAEASSRASLTSPEEEVVGLFDELRDRMLRYVLSLGLTAHDGEEVIQESFLLLFQHLRHGRSRENLRGWVFRVARNLALKLRERNRASLRQNVEFNENIIDAAAASCWNPEDLAWSRQRHTRLLAVVRAMPERDQSCLLLRAEGLRYREIAVALGISLGSVAASLARSLQRLDRADRS